MVEEGRGGGRRKNGRSTTYRSDKVHYLLLPCLSILRPIFLLPPFLVLRGFFPRLLLRFRDSFSRSPYTRSTEISLAFIPLSLTYRLASHTSRGKSFLRLSLFALSPASTVRCFPFLRCLPSPSLSLSVSLSLSPHSPLNNCKATALLFLLSVPRYARQKAVKITLCVSIPPLSAAPSPSFPVFSDPVPRYSPPQHAVQPFTPRSRIWRIYKRHSTFSLSPSLSSSHIVSLVDLARRFIDSKESRARKPIPILPPPFFFFSFRFSFSLKAVFLLQAHARVNSRGKGSSSSSRVRAYVPLGVSPSIPRNSSTLGEEKCSCYFFLPLSLFPLPSLFR